MPIKEPPTPRRRLRSTTGSREALERELMWAIALDGDRQRIEELTRILTPAANDAFRATMLDADAGSQRSPPDGI